MSVSKNPRRWYNRWAKRQAFRVRRRLGKSALHVVVSPPTEGGGPSLAPKGAKELGRLRTAAYRAVRGAYPGKRVVGACVPHPERCVAADRSGGHEGLHFHFALRPLGRYDGRAVARQHKRTGWVVKVLGVRSTLRLVLYELHHAGRWLRRTNGDLFSGPGYEGPLSCPTANSPYATEAVTWIGEPSSLDSEEAEGPLCPVCRQFIPGKDWYEVTWAGEPGKEPRGTSGNGPEGWQRRMRAWE